MIDIQTVCYKVTDADETFMSFLQSVNLIMFGFELKLLIKS
jgi:hypothetical protein